MSETTITSEAAGVIPLHFDVPGHVVSLDAYFATAKAIERMVQALDEAAGGELEPVVVIYPSDDGSFLGRVGLFLLGGGAASVAAVRSVISGEFGKAVIKGATDKTITEWAEEVGRDNASGLRRYQAERKWRRITHVPTTNDDEIAPFTRTDRTGLALSPDVIEDAYPMPTRPAPDPEADEDAGAAAETLAQFIILLLLIETGKFEDAVPNTDAGRALGEARNDFYEGCRADRTIRGIGFAANDDFPVRRARFVPQLVTVPEPPEPDWLVERDEFRVSSPNWEKADKARRWKGRDTRKKWRFFTIEDEDFWDLADADEVQSKPKVRMGVQVAYPKDSPSRSRTRVLRVLTYGQDELAKPLGKRDLDRLLGRYVRGESSRRGQLDFFEDDETNPAEDEPEEDQS